MKSIKRTALILAVLLSLALCLTFGASAEGELTEGENGIVDTHPEAAHSFTNYVSDNNATIFLDGTKTAYCDYGCGEKDTVNDEGSMLDFGKPVTVTSTTTTSEITLSWTADEGATGYRIFYKTASGWAKSATVTGTSHTYKNLKPGSKFTFAVRAYNITDDTLTWATAYTTHETSTQAAAPSKITTSQTTTSLTLNWTTSKGATGYRIYYKSGETWKVAVSTTSKTTHTFSKLKYGSRFTFAVRPYVLTADNVIWSAYTVYNATTKPAKPALSVTCTEAAALDVFAYDEKVDGYQLYYKINNGSYKLYKTYSGIKLDVTFKNLDPTAKYTFALRAGIRTSGGVVWSDYAFSTATPEARCAEILININAADFYADYTLEGVRSQVLVVGNKSIATRLVDSSGMSVRVIYYKSSNLWYCIYDDAKLYTKLTDEQLGLESGLGKTWLATYKQMMSTPRQLKYAKITLNGKTYYTETCTSSLGNTVKFYYDTNNNLKRIDVKYYDGSSEIFYIHELCDWRDTSTSISNIPSDYTYVAVS